MRDLDRNKQTIYYAEYTGNSEITDTEGYRTGEYAKTYGTPQTLFCNVSAARGNAESEIFGTDTQYSKVIITDDMSCPIDEHSILWIGTVPTANTDPYNYIVKGVAKSFNHITYAIAEVSVG